MSMPWPTDWIQERSRDYDVEGKDFNELPWVKECMETTKKKLQEFEGKLSAAEKLCCDPDGPYMYGDVIQRELDAVERLTGCTTYDEVYSAIGGISFDRLSSKKDDSVNPDKRELTKKIRNEAKDGIKNLADTYFTMPSDMVIKQMKSCDRAIKELCRLTLRFNDLFSEKKRERQLIDFSDMEHFALQILVNHPENEECENLSAGEILSKCTPSTVALEYRDYYREVLIDEYQDSNNVQELILKSVSGELPGISERFMVGDVKQSIYKFRLARPEIFMEKLGTYSKEKGSPEHRIDLHRNFRSRKEVLEATNYIFDKIMGKDLGKVDYDEDARLVTGASYDEPNMDMSPEFIMIDSDSSDTDMLKGYSAREKEALLIAGRIRQLLKEDRTLKYKDIVILLRSLSGWDDVFKKILESQGIPSYIESKSGYFDAPEVAIMLNFMTVIDNPAQDIPLVSVMHSELFDFSDEELALCRIAVKNAQISTLSGSFYYALKELLNENGKELLGEVLYGKLGGFVDFVEELREKAVYTPVHELLQYIFVRTGFDSYCLAMPVGNQRKANLDLLLNKALSFEKSSFKGIFHFVRYMENIKIVQVDYGEAGIIDENANVVRIMSIHKSKGLEFPVVFVAGLSKEFNKMDARKELVIDMDLGIGVKYIDYVSRVRFDTLKRVITSDRMLADSLGEELRVLYVALTRAKEKLIMTAAVKKLNDEITKALDLIPSITQRGKLLPYSLRRNSDSYFDLILRALIRHPAFEEALDKLGLSKDAYLAGIDKNENLPALTVKVPGNDEIVAMLLAGELNDSLRREELKRAIMNLDDDPELVDSDMENRLKVKFSSGYTYEYLKGLYTKTTVTELKKHLLEEMGETFGHDAAFVENAEKEAGKPSASETAGLTGAERGTAYHRIMEILDDSIYGDESFMENPDSKRISEWICEKSDNKVIPPEYQNTVWAPDVETFLKTKLGRRMGEAYRRGQLMREKPFMMGISAKELKDSFPEDEMILIQGIIDAWFMEGEDIILMDYKTDRVKEPEELIRRYKIQLDYYKRALEASTKKKVKEIYIYSFALGMEIKL